MNLLNEMKDRKNNIKRMSKTNENRINKVITYFTNQLDRMKYWEYREKGFPIGSGVTEAACKILIKQRMCQSGMQWKKEGAKVVISLRALVKTSGRYFGIKSTGMVGQIFLFVKIDIV